MDAKINLPETPQADLKRCATCGISNLYARSNYKNCRPCRKKNRMKQQLKDQRAKETKFQHDLHLHKVAQGQDLDDPTPTKKQDQNRRLSDPTGSSVPKTTVIASAGVKRKAFKGLHDLDEDEKRMALDGLKNGLKQTVKGNKRVVTPTGITSVSGEGNEYQTASAIYDVLKRKVSKIPDREKRLHFRGFHAIISMPTIDNEKRVFMVANDLRKIARVPFEHTKPSPSYNFETMGRTLEYKCTCLGYDTSPSITSSAPPAVGNTTMTGTPGDLIKQARMRAGVIKTQRLCGGKIRITAVGDDRHPLGILAQRISISIEHPTTTFA